MNVFSWRLWLSWRLWKWWNWCNLEDLYIHARIMKREDFCFRSFIFSFLSHRKHHTVKGGRGNTKETDFQVMLISKSTPTQSFRVKPLEISYQLSQFVQWKRRRSSGVWGICPDWGVRTSLVQIAYTVRNMIALRNSNLKIWSLLCYAPAVQYILPPNGHILEGHLCLIMSGYSLGYKYPPLQPLAGWLLQQKLTLVNWEHPILRGLWAKIIKWGKPKTQTQTYKPKVIEQHWRDCSCVEPMLVSFEDCVSSRRLGVMVWASKRNFGLSSDRVCEGLEVTCEDLPRVLGEVFVIISQGEYDEDYVSGTMCPRV